MQPEPIILLPATHEQSTPSFHVEGSRSRAFIDFLHRKGVDAWQPPEQLEKFGPDQCRLVEIEIAVGTSEEFLEGLIVEFLASEVEPHDGVSKPSGFQASDPNLRHEHLSNY